MTKSAKKEPAREERISMEIVVDCYGPEEQATGWYYYLEDNLEFP
ncbi:MAG: calcium-binding protein, partial [Nitrospirae bacterium]|nr:calcium-binding protein [Nitrospirota bacterium]